MSLPTPMDSIDDRPQRRQPTAPRFELRLGEIFWRVFAVALIALEVAKWLWLRPRIPLRPRVGFPPRLRRIWYMIYHTPELAFRAFLAAAIIAVVSDLIFRLFVRPLMVCWYNPRGADPELSHPHPFFLKANEQTLAEAPARLVAGRKRLRGTLVRTNWGTYFYPFAWDAEPWSLPDAHLVRVHTRTPRRRVLGWVTGYPDNVVLSDDAGEETAFVVADPAAVLGWFRTDCIPSPKLLSL
jgi:hypothetical protein